MNDAMANCFNEPRGKACINPINYQANRTCMVRAAYLPRFMRTSWFFDMEASFTLNTLPLRLRCAQALYYLYQREKILPMMSQH